MHTDLSRGRSSGLVFPFLEEFSSLLLSIQSKVLVVNEAEAAVFLEFPYFFYNPRDVGNLISGSSAFSKSSLYIWMFLVHVLSKPSFKDFQHYLASMWNEFKWVVVWTFFGITLFGDWNENWPFPVVWPLLSLKFCWHFECSTLTASSFRIRNSSAEIPLPSLVLFMVILRKAHLTSHFDVRL